MFRAQILDLLPFGIAVLDPKAKIRFSNRCAFDLLRSSKDVSINHGALVIRSAAHNRAFTGALADFASGVASGPVAFSIARSKSHPLSLVLTSFTNGSAGKTNTRVPQIVAFICDPDLPHNPPVPILQQLFDFTPMESAVASLMLQYADTTAIAKRLEISSDTVRKHMKSMFSKTHCRNQAELLHVLLFNPALLLFANGDHAGHD